MSKVKFGRESTRGEGNLQKFSIKASNEILVKIVFLNCVLFQ
jgi:hypothetical protein